ncbi:MAG: hypothetical protein R2747_01035 [Pyrinomonadaceae bacterium]
MRSSLFKLYAAALIIGIAAVGSAFAQQTMTFNVPFDFQIGKEKHDAGKYEMRTLDNAKFLLKNVETGENMILVSGAQVGDERTVETQKLVFNRYGETYFLREVYARAGTVGRELTESKAERKIRQNRRKDDPQLADNKSEPAKVTVNSAQ